MAEELLQRLLSDPEFRAASPATARSPLESLPTRESRSSLAGVMLGTALEAVALLGLADGAEAAVTPLLGNHNLGFDADGIADLRAGRIDPRVMSVLDRLSHEHHLTISAMRSDHGRLTSGGSVSNHAYGRAVDIAAIDGRPVTPDNDVARRIAIELSHLDPSIRPTEIGSPWSLPGAADFPDAEHQNPLHIGYDDPPNPSDPPPPVAEAPPNGDATADSDDPSTGDADGTGDPDDGDSSGGEDQPDGNDPSGGDADGTDNP